MDAFGALHRIILRGLIEEKRDSASSAASESVTRGSEIVEAQGLTLLAEDIEYP